MAEGQPYLGGNFRGWFAQKAVKEMAEIIEILDGNKETAFGPAGFGDLIATGFSPYSRNRQLGNELVNFRAKGLDVKMKGEGLISLPSIIELLAPYIRQLADCTGLALRNPAENSGGIGENINKFPILQALEEIIIKHKSAKEIFDKLAA